MRQQLLHSDATDHGSYAPNHKGSSINNVLTEALLESQMMEAKQLGLMNQKIQPQIGGKVKVRNLHV